MGAEHNREIHAPTGYLVRGNKIGLEKLVVRVLGQRPTFCGVHLHIQLSNRLEAFECQHIHLRVVHITQRPGRFDALDRGIVQLRDGAEEFAGARAAGRTVQGARRTVRRAEFFQHDGLGFGVLVEVVVFAGCQGHDQGNGTPALDAAENAGKLMLAAIFLFA